MPGSWRAARRTRSAKPGRSWAAAWARRCSQDSAGAPWAARITRSAKPSRNCAEAWSRSARQAWFSVFMLRLVMFAKVLAGAMKASLHCRDAGGKGLGDLGVAAALLHEGEQ